MFKAKEEKSKSIKQNKEKKQKRKYLLIKNKAKKSKIKKVPITSNNLPKNIYLYKANILLLTFYLIIFFIPIFLSKKSILRNLVLESQITITIQGTGDQNILSTEAISFDGVDYTFNSFPKEILINGEYSDFTGKTVTGLTNEENNITIIFDDNITDFTAMFSRLTNIVKIDLSKCDTSKITDMRGMFYGCTSLTSLDLNNINTSSVVNMECMFFNCKSLESLNLNNFDTSSVTTMKSMFEGCTSLKSLYIDNFNTKKVTKLSRMFTSCHSLQSINLKSFDTSSTTEMSCLFYECRALTSLNVKNFNTKENLWMDSMFFGCFELTSLDLRNFDTSKIFWMNGVFSYCYNLKYLDVSSFDTSQVVRMDSMFRDLRSLKYLNLKSFDTSKVTRLDNLFNGCSSLISLNISGIDTTSATNIENMFMNCESLLSLDLKNFDISQISEELNIFSGTNQLVNYCINEANASNILIGLYNFTNFNCTYNCFLYTPSQLIVEKMKCIDFCYNDDTYKFEFNNLCYESCPPGTHNSSENSYICEEDLICDNYYNYEYTDCLDVIPEGYFLNNSELKTIDKCDIKCKTCSLESMQNNLCMTCNNSNNYFQKYNDSSNNNNFIKCYNEGFEGYFLDTNTNMYMPCYSTCKNCNGLGTEHDNKCVECFSDYELINSNCIIISEITTEVVIPTNLEPTNYVSDTINFSTQIIENYSTDIFKITDEITHKDTSDTITTTEIIFDTISSTIIEEESSIEITQISEYIFSSTYISSEPSDFSTNIPTEQLTTNKISSISDINTEYDSSSSADDENNSNDVISTLVEDSKTDYNTDDSSYFSSQESTSYINIDDSSSFSSQESTSYINIDDSSSFSSQESTSSINTDDSSSFSSQESTSDINTDDSSSFSNKESTSDINIDEESENNPSDTISQYETYVYLNETPFHAIENAINELIVNRNLSKSNVYYYKIDTENNELKDKYNNSTFIDFNQNTIDFLFKQFNLDEEKDKLYILIIDYLNNDLNYATTDYDYKFFLENGTELNLSNIKENFYFDIYVPIIDLIASNYNYTVIFIEQGYDIYDKKSNFYNDECTPAYLNQNDITLLDRKKDIYPHNISFCKENCEYKSVNIDEKRIICECNLNINENNINDEDNFLIEEDDGNFFSYLLDYINYKIFKCYKLLILYKNYKKNYAFYSILAIAFIMFVTNFVFCCYGIPSIRKIGLKNIPSDLTIQKETKRQLLRFQSRIMSRKKSKKTKSMKIDSKNIKHHFINSKINNNQNSLKSSNENMVINVMIQPKIKIYNKKKLKTDVSMNILIKKEEDLNELPFTQAIHKDKRNVLQIFISVLFQKLELVNLFFGDNKIKIILVYQYILSLIIDLFFNTFLYSDDIVSKKYHNNGKLDFIATVCLSLTSNIITGIVCNYFNFSKGMEERLNQIMDIKREFNYLYAINKFIKIIKIKVFFYIIIELIFMGLSFYYIVIFCIIYNNSQNSLLINYILSLVESLIISIIISIIIVITRKIGIIYLNINFYNTSKFINSRF